MHSIDTVKNRLSYNKDTGTFVHVRNGRPAGAKRKDGYVQINVLGKFLMAHRIAWAIHYGEWPTSQIDHINGDRSDNRICNLRDVPQSINIQNQTRAHKRSSTGVLGVSVRSGTSKFRASIGLGGKVYYLGDFDTIEDAKCAYDSAKERMHQGLVKK